VRLGLLLLASLTLGLQAEDRWITVKSGPIQIFSIGNERAAREKLVYLEQFRETLRVILGKDDMRLVWPIDVLLYKTPQQLPAMSPHFALARDARMLTLPETGGLSRETIKEYGRLLVNENTAGLEKRFEDALINLVATIQVDGPHITLGAPPPESERTHEWALLQYVATKPEYLVRAHILLSTLQQSSDMEAACKNAFDKSAAEMNGLVDAYLKSGNFATGTLSGRPLSVRDGRVENVDRQDAAILIADLLLATGSPQAGKAYEGITGVRAAEGLGLVALNDSKRDDAREFFEKALDGETKSARAWVEAGNLEADKSVAVVDYKKAASSNPRWAEPYVQMADLEFDPGKRAAILKKATELDSHNVGLWQTLARAETAAKNFQEAQKAWGGAERAAANDEERAKIHQIRLQMDSEQIVTEKTDRKRIKDEKAEDLARVKTESDAAIHAAEEEARKKMNADGGTVPKNAVPMEELKRNTGVDGVFLRLDCLGQQARMVVKTDDGKTVQLLIRDPNGISLTGGSGDKTFGCGAQSGARRVHVEYEGKPDAKLRTTGDVTLIDFR
jgi:tetratricopeptide (TPR) repeat protein